MQTHTGDFVGATQPFQCQPIGNASDAIVLHTNGSLSSHDRELQVGAGSHLACPDIGQCMQSVVFFVTAVGLQDLQNATHLLLLQVILEGGWRNRIAYRAMSQLGIPIMRTWNESVPLWQYHHHYHTSCGDRCNHHCRSAQSVGTMSRDVLHVFFLPSAFGCKGHCSGSVCSFDDELACADAQVPRLLTLLQPQRVPDLGTTCHYSVYLPMSLSSGTILTPPSPSRHHRS